MKIVSAFLFVALAPGLWASQPPSETDKAPDWTPPKTTVAEELVEVGKFLLEHGMADPRGGKFVIAKIKANNPWMVPDSESQTIGWLKEVGGEKVIIDMAGITRQVASVVREISVAEAVEKALELGEKGMIYGCPYNIYKGYVEGRQLSADEQIFSSILTDEAVALLLIDGDQKEAESLFAMRGPVEYDKGKPIRTGIPEPEARYRIVERFIERKLSLAVVAHASKDDKGAEAASRVLVENEEAYRGYLLSPGQLQGIRKDPRTGEVLVLRMLGQAAALHNQALQHVQQGQQKVDWAEFDKLPQKERVRKLIWMLDGVEAGLICGSLVTFTSYPVVDRLIHEDLAAGDALVDCIRNDKRFTRINLMRSNGSPADALVTVKSVAMTALELIEKQEGNIEFGQRPGGEEKLLAYWNEVKRLTPMERWMKVLCNAKAQPIQWIYASQWFLKPDVDEVPNWQFQEAKRPMPPARFRSLSKGQKSELVDLLLKRAKEVQIGKSGEPSELAYASSNRLELAIAAYKIDPKRAARDLKDLVYAAYGDRKLIEQGMYGPRSNLAKGLGLLMAAKNGSAAENYASWLKEFKADSGSMSDLFVPLLYLPPIQGERVVKDLLTDPKSTMYISPADSWARSSLASSMARSPLIMFPSFRTLYTKLMADTTTVGPIKVTERDRNAAIVPLRTDLSFYSDQIDPNDLPDARKAVCRVCDYYAAQIRSKGAPEFKTYWTIERKDAAIKKLIEYLNEHYQDIADEAQRYRLWQL